MNKDRHCVFESKDNKSKCTALTIKLCKKNKECKFYKSENEYCRDADGYIVKRSDD